MKNLRLLMFPVLAICAFCPHAEAQKSSERIERYRLVVAVMSADRGEPVEGATVTTIFHYSSNESETALKQTERTGQDGKAYIIYELYDWQPYYRFDVTISHPDFVETYRNVPITKNMRSGDLSVSVSIRRNSDLKVVAVNLVAAGDKAPIYDARIALRGTREFASGTKSVAMYDGTTDMNGKAVINVTEGDDYDVTISHYGFETLKTTLTVKGFDDEQKTYNLNLEMKRTKQDVRTLRVSIKSRNKNGEEVAVHFAEVRLAQPNAASKMTDYQGNVEFKHNLPPGEEIKVEAEANHYKPGSGSFTVGVRSTHTSVTDPIFGIPLRVAEGGVDNLTIWLQPDLALVWERVGEGDCAYNDELPFTEGSDKPDDSRAKEGHTAVCWDGSNKNDPGKVFCTYKTIAPDQCKGGKNPGVMYRAVPR